MNKQNWLWFGIGIAAGMWVIPRLQGAIAEGQ